MTDTITIPTDFSTPENAKYYVLYIHQNQYPWYKRLWLVISNPFRYIFTGTFYW